MSATTKLPWLKIIGWAILTHIILIAISFLEVFLYSLINPGHENSFYEEHAQVSAPYISIIFGFILFFLVARQLCKQAPDHWIAIVLLLPILYIILDFLMLLGYDVDWGEHLLVFMASFLSKALGAYLGAIAARRSLTKI